MKLNVSDMACGHCVSVIKKAVSNADPYAFVSIDLTNQSVSIDSLKETAVFVTAIEEAGYSATPVT